MYAKSKVKLGATLLVALTSLSFTACQDKLAKCKAECAQEEEKAQKSANAPEPGKVLAACVSACESTHGK